ncbi:MAG: hypothetical protein II947_10190 [Bacteroidaceae bacterium]|nr:hypothetical protein [Bacteroidaceae bacterium]
MKNLYLGDNPCRMKNLLHSSFSIISKLQFCQSPLLRFSVSFGFAEVYPPPSFVSQ